MNAAKVKHIVLAILVLLNAVLLSFLGADLWRKAASERASEKAMKAILASEDVTLSADVNISQEAAPLVTLRRDTDTEKTQMASLLGRTTVQDLGGNIFYYSGTDGEAQMRGTGEFDIMLQDYEGDSTRKGAEAIMKKLGMPDAGTAALTGTDDSYNLTAFGSYGGYPVYNAKTDFILSSGRFLMISGVKVFDDEISSTTEGVMSAYDAIAALVSLMENEGYVCSTLEGVEAGYSMSVPVSGECTLTPVWFLRTDTADIYINALTGNVEYDLAGSGE